MPPHREIRADYDDRAMVVYQAYREEIASRAVQAQRFVAPFSYARMTWIKPSFLWVMERCGWATKQGQERVLAVRITRDGWESALRQAVLSDRAGGDAPVRVQWDPERDVRGGKLAHRSIQVGLSPAIIRAYVEEWTTEILDLSDLVARLRALRDEARFEEAERLLPIERPYPTPEDLRCILGMDEG